MLTALVLGLRSLFSHLDVAFGNSVDECSSRRRSSNSLDFGLQICLYTVRILFFGISCSRLNFVFLSIVMNLVLTSYFCSFYINFSCYFLTEYIDAPSTSFSFIFVTFLISNMSRLSAKKPLS